MYVHADSIVRKNNRDSRIRLDKNSETINVSNNRNSHGSDISNRIKYVNKQAFLTSNYSLFLLRNAKKRFYELNINFSISI